MLDFPVKVEGSQCLGKMKRLTNSQVQTPLTYANQQTKLTVRGISTPNDFRSGPAHGPRNYTLTPSYSLFYK